MKAYPNYKHKACLNCGSFENKRYSLSKYCIVCEELKLTCISCGKEFKRKRVVEDKSSKQRGGDFKVGPICSHKCMKTNKGHPENFVRWYRQEEVVNS